MAQEKTIATMFSGGECVGVGARDAGYRHLWGIEYLPRVAHVAEANGFHSIVADVRDVDPRDLESPYALHASPPCKEAGGANGERVESNEGRELGQAISHFIEILQPEVFTLENVWFYRTFDSFSNILRTLYRIGYEVAYAHLNSANFGVPQTRMRLILRASRWLLRPLPDPDPWVGWYEAIEDLIPALPESRLAPWQLKRMPKDLAESALFSRGIKREYERDGGTLRYRSADMPCLTITTENAYDTNAVLFEGRTGGARKLLYRKSDEPAATITTSSGGNISRALLEDGRIVRLSMRALARLQSIPDSYVLPDRSSLAHYIIGNAVPPLMYQKLIANL